ncbi:protein Wnt-8a-like [Mytilus trossulus]|uniref:protein Wnt-8a-like n=1 Tax=Mytilus trossulus TaxID=6551 RepID=UPI0030040973
MIRSYSYSWICLFIVCSFNIYTSKSWSLNEILIAGPKVGLTSTNYTRNPDLFTRHPVEAKILDSVRKGTLKAQEECQHQFKWERWNCPADTAPFDQDFATREAAFVQSINAAGIMHVVTQQCSSGQETFCTCDNSRNGQTGGFNWKWGGCSDNIKFGDELTYKFLKGLTSGKNENAAMQLQNYGAGRQAVGRNTKMVCKCHGLSGDCSIRTCWQQVATFREIGQFLKQRYKKAKFVNYYDGQLRQGNDARTRELAVFSKKQLAFLQKSPNYCKEDHVMNIKGTKGRQCMRSKNKNAMTTSERKSCRTLCKSCGYKVKKVTVDVSNTCNCKFRWCCKVKCDKCVTRENNYYCVR